MFPLLLDPNSLRGMRRAGRSAAATLSGAGRILRPGLRTAEIDRFVRRDTARRGGTPAQLGYHGFPASVCTSRNQVVCHGIPSPSERLEEGDLLNVDVTTCLEGWHGDTSRTFLIGAPSPEARHLVEVAERCLWAGIEAVRPGRRLGEVGAAIEALARAEGCSVVTDFGGHGIGRAMHLPPHVSHVGPAGRGPVLVEGMCFTIEPMINLGGPRTRILEDGWTVVTEDGALSAQFEHTVRVGAEGAEVLTRAR